MVLTKSKVFLIGCLSFILGVFIGRFINSSLMAISAMFFVAVATIGWQSKVVVVIGIAGLVSIFGAWRFQATYSQNDLTQFYNQKVAGIGVIVGEPDKRLDKIYLTVGQLEIQNQNLSSKLLLSVPLFPEYEYGQRIRFSAKIQEPKDFDGFSYKNYLSRFGIDAVAYQPKIQIENNNSGSWFMAHLLKLKERFVQNINLSLPEPHSSFMGGLLLGAKRSIPQKILDQFAATGTSHIVAISGYNITVIAAGVAWALQQTGMRKRFSFLLAVAAILGFVFMTGASSAVVRAGVMGILLLVALNIGRIYDVNNALAFSAMLMVFINPQVLHFDIGFQLSFAALLGLVYFTPMIEPYFWWMPAILRPFLLATLSAQVFTLPILLFYFGQVSLIAPIMNVLVLLAVPPAMFFGFLTGLLGFVWIKLAFLAAAASWILLTYILKAVELGSRLPFAAVNFTINFYVVVIYYLGLTLIVRRHCQKEREIWKSKPNNF